MKAPTKFGGGSITLGAGGHAQLGPGVKLDARSSTAGSIRLRAGSADVAGILLANGKGPTSDGGEMRLRALAGDLALNGTFLATGHSNGGVIEATAANDLTAVGRYRAAGAFFPNSGCIALSAGGTLDTSGAEIDPAPVPDCPGSPSGAFLDAP